MNKFYKILIGLNLLIIFGLNSAATFQVISITTFTASVSFVFADTKPPQITHTPLERISPYTKIAIVTGSVTDETRITSINIYYKKSSEIFWSTYTITLQNLLEYNFSFQIPENFITENIQYRITASDGENIAMLPADGSWYSVPVDKTFSRKIGTDGGTITIPDGNPLDGETSIEIPKGALSETTEITIEEIDPNSPSIPDGYSPCLTKRPHTAYKFSPEGLTFKKPVKINLLYLDINNDGKLDGSDYSETDDISIFWLDKIQKWRVVGGKSNTDLNTISAKISHFSIFAVFPRKILTASDYRPKEKIITPYGDNRKIHFDGLAGIDTEIKIYDIRGRKIKTIKDAPYEWDATDDSNNIVESGVYIYQFRAGTEGKIISGTIAVAK